MCTHLVKIHGISVRVIRRRCSASTGGNMETFWAFTFKCRVPTLVNNLNNYVCGGRFEKLLT